MAEPTWMIYGANGYTGRLIAERAAEEGMRPVLAGRRAQALRPLARRLGLDWTAFDLDDADALADALRAVDLVLHCAGPFSVTSAPMADACIETKTHYLDITGEIPVFEALHARAADAEAAGVVVMPGVGFDVVPSDWLALALARQLPDATRLDLAIAGFARMSPGTMKTVVENLPKGGMVRRAGKLVPVPPAFASMRPAFADRPRTVVAMPWGDVSTAYYTTGIPNITVYMEPPPGFGPFLKLTGVLRPVLANPTVQRALQGLVGKTVAGPSEEFRRTARVHLWGRVTDADGATVEGTLEVPEGYTTTVYTALACVRKVLAGDVSAGAWTPARAFGPDLAADVPGAQFAIAAG